jgi:hypothetical protein
MNRRKEVKSMEMETTTPCVEPEEFELTAEDEQLLEEFGVLTALEYGYGN